jgi:hypothetical protein
MGRARLVLVVIGVCAFGSAAGIIAQTVAPPEGWVVLPVDEYRVLRERALPPVPPPAAPPVDATLTRVDYDLRVDSDSVAGRALLTIDVLREGWSRIQIPTGLMVRDARLDGQPVALVEGPPPHVLLARAGRSVLTLDIVIPLTASAGTESITLPASPSPISRATLVLPRSGVELSLTGGFIADRAESANESRWTAFGRPNQPLRLSWKRKVDDRRAEQPLRVRARVTQVAGLGEDACQVTAAVRVEVLQGLAREVTVALPAGFVVNQVNGATVGDWDGNGSTLRVRLLEPVATETSFVVQGESRAPREGTVVVPLVRIPSAERETGGVAVDIAGAGEIAGGQPRGLEPADPSELGDLVAGRESPSMIAFRLRPLAGSETRSLTVTVVRYTPQAVLIANVEEARYRTLASEDGRLLVEARYAVRNNQRSFLKVSMPAGSTVWSARVAGRPIRPGVAGTDAVLLPLDKGRAGEEAPTFVVELVYLQRIDAWLDKGRARLDLPALDLPVSRTGLELHYSPRFRVELQPGSFRVEDDPGPFAEALRHPSTNARGALSEVEGRPVAPPARPSSMPAERAAAGLQALVDRFRNESSGRTVIGSLPVQVTFPTFGPSIFLASELTAEARAPSVELVFKRAKG